jgi:hypothetical protein
VLLSCRWVVEHRFGRLAPFERLSRDCERLHETPAPCTSSSSPPSLMLDRLCKVPNAPRTPRPLTKRSNKLIAVRRGKWDRLRMSSIE